MRRLFKEEVERIQERNRNVRYGRWGNLLVKILLVIAILYFINNFNKNSVDNILWFVHGGKSPAGDKQNQEK